MGLEETNSNFELRRGTPCFQTPVLDDTEVLFGWRPQRFGPIGTVSRAKGVYLYDAQDRPILDLASGQVNVNLGHGHEGVLRAMRAQFQDFCYAGPCLNSDVREALTAEIGKVVPFAEETKVFLCNSGSEAVENAIKLAWAMTGRTKIYAASPSYHGATIGASSLSGDARRRYAELGITGVRHFTPPFVQHPAFEGMSEEEAVHISLSLLRDQIARDGPDTVAAIFVESVIGFT